MGFSRILDGLPFPSLEDLPDPGIRLGSPALQAVYFYLFFTCLSHQGNPNHKLKMNSETNKGMSCTYLFSKLLSLSVTCLVCFCWVVRKTGQFPQMKFWVCLSWGKVSEVEG